jgi:hypothetical protein
MHFRVGIAARFLLAFAAVIVVFGGAVMLSIVRLADFKATVHSITVVDLPKQETANAWIVSLLQTARHTRNMLIFDDAAAIKAELEAVQEDTAKGKEYMDALIATQGTRGLAGGRRRARHLHDARGGVPEFGRGRSNLIGETSHACGNWARTVKVLGRARQVC